MKKIVFFITLFAVTAALCACSVFGIVATAPDIKGNSEGEITATLVTQVKSGEQSSAAAAEQSASSAVSSEAYSAADSSAESAEQKESSAAQSSEPAPSPAPTPAPAPAPSPAPAATYFDSVINEKIAQVTNSSMSQFEKLKACYTFLTVGTRYGSCLNYGTHYRNGGSFYKAIALGLIIDRQGMCDAYTAAFVAFARALGYDAHHVEGLTGARGGGTTGHDWAQINIDGVTYIFDAQLENQIYGGGTFNRFCKTASEIGDTYIYQNTVY